MIVERAMHEQFLSNTYLVADGYGGPAFFVDAGGPVKRLIEAAERLGLEPTHVLLTHHHFDHVSEAGALRERWPKIEVLISPIERDLLAGEGADTGAAGANPANAGMASAGRGAAGAAKAETVATGTVQAGETLRFGALEVHPLHTPGHTAGMLSFLVGDRSEAPGAAAEDGGRRQVRSSASTAPGGFTGGEAVVFTGDTLFKGSVGGVRAPGHTTYTDLRDSIMGTLMELPPETVIYPGHTDATTVAREWDANEFIRIWRGLDPQGAEPCTALGEPATLVLLGEDYDGGKKAWVRWENGSDDIVPGSRVQRA
jgi:hydroxyacylglutathione hydrolase